MSKRKVTKTDKPYTLIQKSNGVWMARDKKTLKRTSLKCKGTRQQAEEIADIQFGNTDDSNAMHHMKAAEAHLMKCNPEWVTTTWDMIAQQAINCPRQVGRAGKKSKRTLITLASNWNNKIWDGIRHKRCIDTVATDFGHALKGYGRGLVDFGKLLHNYAMDRKLIPYPIMGKKCWPRTQSKKMSRSITEEDHLAIIKYIQDPKLNCFRTYASQKAVSSQQWRDEWENWLWFLWWTGASNKDAANVCAEDIDWKKGIVKFHRSKTGTKVTVGIGESLATLLKKLPKKGFLFPCLQARTTDNRGRVFNVMVDWCGLEKVTIHGYRFGWAERAKEGGMSTEDRMAALGHQSVQMATHYDEKGDYIPASIEVIDGGLKAA